MKILAIDSSGTVASVAILEDRALVGEYTINYKKTHSQTLLPMIDTLAEMIDLDKSSLDAVAVAKGPGSFTGLRIGSATAKGLALALDIPVLEVPTVDALACNLYGTQRLIVPMMDARRSQVYTGIYRFTGDRLETVKEQCVCTIDELLDELNRMPEEEVIFLGDGVPVNEERIREHLQIPYSFAPPHLSRQRAGAVAFLGAQYMAEGKAVSAEAHVPEYLRASQAEREREARGLESDVRISDLLEPHGV